MTTLALNSSNMQELSVDEQRKVDGGGPLLILGVVAAAVVIICVASFAYGYYQGRRSK